MEVIGYKVIDCGAPDQRIVQEIKNYYNGCSKITAGSTTHVEGNKVCERFLGSGAGDSPQDIAQQELPNAKIKQGPVMLGHNPSANTSMPKMGHPSEENGITLIRMVCGGSISDGRGIFKLYAASHHQSVEEDPLSLMQPVMTPNKVFVIHGKFRWEIVPPEDCLLVWI